MTPSLPRKSDDNDSGSDVSGISDEDHAGASEFPSHLFMKKDDSRKKPKAEEKSTTDRNVSKKAAKGKANKTKGPGSKRSGEKIDSKSSTKKKKSSDKSPFGGSSMPRQKTKSNSDGGGGKGSFMATLENLMNPPEHAIKNRKDSDNDAANEGSQEHNVKQGAPSRILETLNHSMRGKFGAGDTTEGDDDKRGVTHENRMEDSSMRASKRNRKGLMAVKQKSTLERPTAQLDIGEASGDRKNRPKVESDNQSNRRSRNRSDLNASMTARLDYSSDDAGGDGSNRRRKKPQQRGPGRSGTNTSISNVSGDGTSGVPKTDEEALLEVMSGVMANELYFPEVGYFDWKKWRKHKTKRRRRRRKRRGPRGGRARPTHPDSSERNERSLSPDQRALKSFDRATKLSSAHVTPHRQSKEKWNSVTVEMNRHRSMENIPSTTRGSASTQEDLIMSVFDDLAVEANTAHQISGSANIDFGMFGDSKEGSGDFGIVNSATFDIINVVNLSKGSERNPGVPAPPDPQKSQSYLEGDNDIPLLDSRKAPARESRIIGVRENVEEASFDHDDPPGQLVRQDSAARELKKLATFMTAIDVLSKRESIVTKNEKAQEQSACCVIL
jgi:hypothetical protein